MIQNPNEWWLFIDSSKYCLKVILIHNANIKQSLPFNHAVNGEETFETISTLIKVMKYKQHNWQMSGDLKVNDVLPYGSGIPNIHFFYACAIAERANIISQTKSTHPK